MVKLCRQISEEMAERQAGAIAKKKIDARRERLRSQRDADASDPVSLASQETERAKKRASSVSGRDIGINDLSKSKDGDSKERSEEHTSELQSLMRISYAVFCLKKKTKKHQ